MENIKNYDFFILNLKFIIEYNKNIINHLHKL